MHRDPLADLVPLIRRVYAYVAYRLGDGPNAEDVTNDVFERALRYRHTYDRAKGEPLPWLIGIARYRLVECHRELHDHGECVLEPPNGSADIPEFSDLEESAVQRLMLAEAIKALKDRDRELVALRYGADMTARQIAELLGMSVNGVEVAFHRVLARLRSHLEVETRPALRTGPQGRQSSSAQVTRGASW
jgi:RNA polymerase sigma-70 factor (ECF subfamily)